MILQWRDCARGFTKGLLMGLNGLCILIAVFMIGCYIVDARIVQQYGEAHINETIVGDVFMIVTCSLLIGIACFGCVGAARENVKYLYLYVGLLIILMVIELMLSILVSLLRYGLEFSVRNWLRNDFFRNVTASEMEEHTKLWQRLQNEYECCGLNGPQDYIAMGDIVDLSCCERAYNARNVDAQNRLYTYCIMTDSYYKNGCEQEILYNLQTGNDLLLSVAAISFTFETIAVLLTMWLANNLKNEVKIYKETVRY